MLQTRRALTPQSAQDRMKDSNMKASHKSKLNLATLIVAVTVTLWSIMTIVWGAAGEAIVMLFS